GYRAGEGYAEMLFDQRSSFLDESGLPPSAAAKYRELAMTSLRRARIGRLADKSRAGDTDVQALRSLGDLLRDDPRMLFLSDTWRLLAAELGARRARRVLFQLTRGQSG